MDYKYSYCLVITLHIESSIELVSSRTGGKYYFYNRVETEREIPKLKFLVVKLICE